MRWFSGSNGWCFPMRCEPPRSVLELLVLVLCGLLAGCGGGGSSATTQPSLPTVTFTATPTTVAVGKSTLLTWSSTNATTCTAHGPWTSPQVLSGSDLSYSILSSTTFSITCTGSGGSVTKDVTVDVSSDIPVPTVSLAVTPQSIIIGKSTLLTWSTANVSECTATGAWSGSRNLSGSEPIEYLTQAATYVLTCMGSGGGMRQSATVDVFPPTSAPAGIQAAPGDGAILVSWQSLAGYLYQGMFVTSNIYVSTKPGIDVSAFVESSSNRVLRGLTSWSAPKLFKGLVNGTPVYVVVTDVAGGVESVPSGEISVTPQPIPPLVEHIEALNDSGLTECTDLSRLKVACPITSVPNQDAEQGRDAVARTGQLTKMGFGSAGFDFTKLDSAGSSLPNSAPTWDCIRDNVTGLTWEVPTASGLTSKGNTYTWYEPDPLLNGGNAGMQNGGYCTGSDCDTHAFIATLNSSGLCGLRDWRLPTRRELFSLADFSRTEPAMDTSAFPELPPFTNGFFWSSTVDSGTSSVGGTVWTMGILTGALGSYSKFPNGYGITPGSVIAVSGRAID